MTWFQGSQDINLRILCCYTDRIQGGSGVMLCILTWLVVLGCGSRRDWVIRDARGLFKVVWGGGGGCLSRVP